MIQILIRLLLVSISFTTIYASAAAQGGSRFGGFLGLAVNSQDDLEQLGKDAEASDNALSVESMGSGLELAGFYQYRFSGSMWALQFRPSYFMQSADGSGSSSSYEYSANAFTFFPIMKMYPLENSFIGLYMQLGIGFGMVFGDIKEATASTEYSGNSLGYLVGLGVDFCFFQNHCIALEANLRQLSFERLTADSHSGGLGNLTQAQSGKEVEIDGRDLEVSLSGILTSVGYIYRF